MINDHSIMVGGYPLGGIIRRVRRKVDFSQRELAKYAKVSAASIAGFETGAVTPSLATLQKVLHAANYQLAIIDVEGRLVTPLEVWQDVADGAGRRFPAHLDTILGPVYGEWWADVYGLESPPETFRRNRAYRDWKRAQSRWEVRVAELRFAPQPRKPTGRPGWEWHDDGADTDPPWVELPACEERVAPGSTGDGAADALAVRPSPSGAACPPTP